MKLNPDLVRSQLAAEEIWDLVDDYQFRSSGGQTGYNDSELLCPGNKTVLECSTTSALTKYLLRSIYGIRLPDIEDTSNESDRYSPTIHDYEKEDEKHTATASCDSCGFECKALTRVSKGRANEKIRYHFSKVAN